MSSSKEEEAFSSLSFNPTVLELKKEKDSFASLMVGRRR